MDVKEAVAGRRSIRQYAETSIPQEHMEILFKALQLAPSASNLQNWEFIFVRDPHIKQHLVPACYMQKFVAECAYFIAGIADPSLRWHMVDITIALTNFTLQAVEFGYGTCWIGAFDELMVKEVLGVPEERKVVICMTFGLPRTTPPARARKRIEGFIHLDSYGRRWQHAS
ncbi:MAG: nitroreductase family protein [Desulfobacteraceae bacterium]